MFDGKVVDESFGALTTGIYLTANYTDPSNRKYIPGSLCGKPRKFVNDYGNFCGYSHGYLFESSAVLFLTLLQIMAYSFLSNLKTHAINE